MVLLSLETELRFGRVILPPFSISEGEVCTIDWPDLLDSKWTEEFLAKLVDSTGDGAFSILRDICYINPRKKTFLNQRMSDIPQIDRLLGCLPLEMQQRLSQAMKDTVSAMPGTFRNLIALHSACTKSRLVVFDASGVDPCGEKCLRAYAVSRTAEGFGFVYLRFPLAKGRPNVKEGSATARIDRLFRQPDKI